jgi:hemolysin III
MLGCVDCDTISDPGLLGERPQSFGEELANSVSHGLGALAVLAGMPALVKDAIAHGRTASLMGASVFGATLLLLYLTSTLYHALPRGRGKHVLRRVEHSLIYILIAGTYTPFTLGVLRGPWGWTLFGLIWTFALLGVLLKVYGGVRHPRLAMVLYLLMGWLVVVAIEPLWVRMPHQGLLWIVLGGLAYTAGVPFYRFRWRYSHFVWHLFVLAGSGFHYFAILWYAT